MSGTSDAVDLLYLPIGVSAQEEHTFVEAMGEMPVLLARGPVSRRVSVRRLPHDVEAEAIHELSADRDLTSTLEAVTLQLSNALGLGSVPRLIVACPRIHALARAFRQKQPSALWGGRFGPLAAVYEHGNRYIIWHETLHLFGARDCYHLPDEGPTCECGNCIMQYVPTEQTVGEWPFLCRENVGRVQEAVG